MKRIVESPLLFLIANICLCLCSFTWAVAQDSKPTKGLASAVPSTKDSKLETAIFGGGCFWCTEAVYQRVNGVKSIVSGYAGGTVPHPSYKAVTTGATGHAEVVQVTFDPDIVSFEELLLVFFKTHDPTSLNQQGADIGTQYRSVVFYADEAQRLATEKIRDKLVDEKIYRKIVTEISPQPEFYPAEAYHQNYFNTHPQESYCRSVIVPKIAKFEKLFEDISRKNAEKRARKEKKESKK